MQVKVAIETLILFILFNHHAYALFLPNGSKIFIGDQAVDYETVSAYEIDKTRPFEPSETHFRAWRKDIRTKLFKLIPQNKQSGNDFRTWRQDIRKKLIKFLPGNQSSNIKTLIDKFGGGFNEELSQLINNQAECRLSDNLAVCYFLNQRDMNLAFNRVEAHSCGGMGCSVGEIPPIDHPSLYAVLDLGAGHHVSSQELEAFFAEVDLGDHRLILQEVQLKGLFTRLKRHFKDDFSLIAIESYFPDESFISHEYDHFRFNFEAGYAEAITEFVNDVLPKRTKNALVKTLEKYGYSMKNPRKMVKEISAHLLMHGAERDKLGKFVKNLRPKLEKYLRNRGFSLYYTGLPVPQN